MAAAKKIRPPAELNLRPHTGDRKVSVRRLKTLQAFQSINFGDTEGMSGTLVLRRYRAGEVICAQNEPAYTAFYILSRQDVIELGQEPEGLVEGPEAEAQPVARVVVGEPPPPAPGPWSWLRKKWARRAGRDAQKPGVVMFEGELFGEMGCLYRTPRTATVVALRDCAVLELLRNILDKMYANKEFKERLKQVYRQRVLRLDLRRLAVFRDLPDELFEEVKKTASLQDFDPGDLICDEHERSDTLYIIRSGFVKVIKSASALLDEAAVQDLAGLCKALLAGGQEAAGPRKKLCELLLKSRSAEWIRKAATGETLADAERLDVVFSLNDLLRDHKLYTLADFKAAPETAGWEAQAKKLSANPKKLSQHHDARKFNRRLLNALFPAHILPHDEGLMRLLAFRSAGEMIGETGVMLGLPRSASCVAYDHYGEGKDIHGRVEMVSISRELFEKMRQQVPAVDAHVRQVAATRKQETVKTTTLPMWHEDNPAATSRQFEEMGLIQGQKLMLIDLDRCTRCDKCVEACVATHTKSWWQGLLPERWTGNGPRDGRSRLFLDGPRFEVIGPQGVKNFLVPSTCRQCRDPVCLIGCPVGSIHKGEHGQIVIENWCIGCSRCAEQCPYGSIQMHSVGVLRRKTHVWYHRRGKGPWLEGRTPFRSDREFRALYPGSEPVVFQTTFDLDSKTCAESKAFNLHLLSAAAAPVVELNGRPLVLQKVDKKDREDRWNYEALLLLRLTAPEKLTVSETHRFRPLLQPGRNKLTVRLEPMAEGDAVLMELAVMAVAEPVVPQSLTGDFNQELVLRTAVVCDMCSGQLGRQPACVNACPHEAAMRIDVTPETIEKLLQ